MTAYEPLPMLLTIDEPAELLGVSARHVRRLLAEKRVPHLKWRHFIRFDPDEVRTWFDSARRPHG